MLRACTCGYGFIPCTSIQYTVLIEIALWFLHTHNIKFLITFLNVQCSFSVWIHFGNKIVNTILKH